MLTYSNGGVTPIATGVGAVQFVIHYNTDNSRTTVGCYREIDIVGTATQSPEPGTLALLAAGLAGLLAYAGRKRRIAVRFASKIVACALAVTLIASYASATPIVSCVQQLTPSSITVSATDLANQGQSTFLSISATSDGLYGGNVNNLNDGLKYGTQGQGSTQGADAFSAGGTCTITFNTSVNTAGYNITEIQTFAWWYPANAGLQNYDVAYSTVSNPTFVALISTGTQGSATFSSSQAETQVTIVDSLGAVLATGVKALQFTFHTPAGSTNSNMGEIDVFGTATQTPEPGTLALLAAGLAGLLCYAWRKRR